MGLSFKFLLALFTFLFLDIGIPEISQISLDHQILCVTITYLPTYLADPLCLVLLYVHSTHTFNYHACMHAYLALGST